MNSHSYVNLNNEINNKKNSDIKSNKIILDNKKILEDLYRKRCGLQRVSSYLKGQGYYLPKFRGLTIKFLKKVLKGTKSLLKMDEVKFYTDNNKIKI